MYNWILAAKFIALKESAKSIEVSHLAQALQHLECRVGSEDLWQKLISVVNRYEPNAVASSLELTISDEDLEEMRELGIMSFDRQSVLLIEDLKKLQIDTSSEISKPKDHQPSNMAATRALLKRRRSLRKISRVTELLDERIYGQKQAVEVVNDAIARMEWTTSKSSPRAVFSFLGPPATGKTYTAKVLAEALDDYKFKSFDMSQYTSHNQGFALVGLSGGYKDAKPGELTEFVKQNPKSIIVFDEFEKAHTGVQKVLLQIFSEGRLVDGCTNQSVDFRSTIIIITSNLGSSLYTNRKFMEVAETSPHQARAQLMNAISKEFKREEGHSVLAIPPEMLSRLSQGEIVLFNKLDFDALKRIGIRAYLSESDDFESRLAIKIHHTSADELTRLLVLSFAPVLDAREIKGRLPDLIFDQISDYFLANPDSQITKVVTTLDEQSLSFLSGIDTQTLVKKLALKREKIFFDCVSEVFDDCLRLIYKNTRVEKIPDSSDFAGSSGIQVTLPDIRFSDIAGHSSIKQRLSEAISLLKNKSKLASLNTSLPRGILLYGPPGTGKTMIAKAFAKEAGLPFIACAGHDLLKDGFIEEIFARAKEYAPTAIFIDEIDAIPKRGNQNSYTDIFVNKLLIHLDGFDDSDEIIVIAATNRKELIDPALLRSGRIDLHYEVPRLDKEARRWFLRKIADEPFFSESIYNDGVLALTTGFSGADFAKLKRESILAAVREDLVSVSEAFFIEQINTLKYGTRKSRESVINELRETAYHEAGHAVLTRLLMPEIRIQQLTIVARSNFLGMLALGDDNREDLTRENFFKKTCVALAGRAAQMKEFGEDGIDVGASNDLKQASYYAHWAIAELGMDEQMFNISPSYLKEGLGYMPFQDEVSDLIREWMNNATTQTNTLINQHWEKVVRVAEAVLEHEVLTQDMIIELMEA